MARLIVKNIGPIADVDIELKKLNVFMGPQSCGKSTLAKIISFCSWMEKEKFFRDGWENFCAHKTLRQYHKLTGPYFRDDSSILYLGDNIAYSYNNDEAVVKPLVPDYIKKGMTMHGDKESIYIGAKTINPKVMYIPAERNLVSAIPNLTKYAEGNDSLMDTVYNWYDAVRRLVASESVDILNLGVSFSWNKNGMGEITLKDGQRISLQQASSGLQSIVPLVLLIEWLAKGIYKVDKAITVEQRDRIQELLKDYFHANVMDEKADMKKQLDQLVGMARDMVYTHTQFVVEEPEANLFPETQCDLLYYMLNSLNHGKNHRMVITTHSPYILYALNNCLLANIVRKQVEKEEADTIPSLAVYVDPHDVAVWEIEDGRMKTYGADSPNHTIQDKDGLIRKNYFNSLMQSVMRDFSRLLIYKD